MHIICSLGIISVTLSKMKTHKSQIKNLNLKNPKKKRDKRGNKFIKFLNCVHNNHRYWEDFDAIMPLITSNIQTNVKMNQINALKSIDKTKFGFCYCICMQSENID